jgi:hypothetical protein
MGSLSGWVLGILTGRLFNFKFKNVYTVYVECLILRSPGQAPYGANLACSSWHDAGRAADCWPPKGGGLPPPPSTRIHNPTLI